MTLATQICLMSNGVLQQYDAPLTVYHHPKNLFVADFVGNPPINFVEAKAKQQPDGSIALTALGGRRAEFVPASPVDLAAWAAQRDRRAAEAAEERSQRARESGSVEKSNKDERFLYHIDRASGEDDSPTDLSALTDEDVIIAVRPEFLELAESGALEGRIYGVMPTGMESTIKVRVDDFLLTGVIFGSGVISIGARTSVRFKGSNILLFDRQSGEYICEGSLHF